MTEMVSKRENNGSKGTKKLQSGDGENREMAMAMGQKGRRARSESKNK